jgi:hypothetical protein
MAPRHFDAITQSLWTASSRRTAVGLLLGGILGAGGFSVSQAKKHKKHKKHNKKKHPDCTPACTGRDCGADGCGGSCGSCDEGESCQDGACTTNCVPDCAGKACGDNGCGESCGNCAGGRTCVNGTCCTPASVPETCAGDCGHTTNNCGQAVNCGSCPTETCADQPCKDGGDSAASCVDTPSPYHCNCSTGYFFNGVTCAPPCGAPGIDPCSPGTCSVTGGSYTCSCPVDYVYNGKTCLPEEAQRTDPSADANTPRRRA